MKCAAASISVVIPHWNRRDLLAGLFSMLDRQTAGIREYILVDNGSSDDSSREADRLGARVIRLPSNAGFARAVNLGVSAAETEWVAVLNNDVLLDEAYLDLLSQSCIESGAKLASGKLFAHPREQKILDGTWDLVSRAGCGWRAGQGRHDGPEWDAARRVPFVPFTAVMIHKPTFLALGGLDEEYGSYLEDLDFCCRASQGGYWAYYVPDAIGVHLGSATLGAWSSAMVRSISRNQFLFVRKLYPLRLRRKLRRETLAGQLLWGLLALRHGAFIPWVLGKLDGWKAVRKISASGPDTRPETMERLLLDSEKEIYSIQRKSGFDWYWRAYFRLCGD